MPIYFADLDQMQEEVAGCLSFIDQVYSERFGLKELELHPSTRPHKRVGTDEIWNRAEDALMEALKAWDRPYTVNEGDGAFYGPKIDVRVRDDWAVGINVPLYNLILIYLIDLTLILRLLNRELRYIPPRMLGSWSAWWQFCVSTGGGRWLLWISLPASGDCACERFLFSNHASTVQQRIRNAWSSFAVLVISSQHDEIIGGTGTLKSAFRKHNACSITISS